MDSLDVFSATCLYYFFVFVVFSLRGHRNKVIITVISSEVMSPVTRIMFKIQVQLFFGPRVQAMENRVHCAFSSRDFLLLQLSLFIYFFQQRFFNCGKFSSVYGTALVHLAGVRRFDSRGWTRPQHNVHKGNSVLHLLPSSSCLQARSQDKRIKTESIRKLSNFNFQWTKTLYQNNLNNIAFFFTFFKRYRYNQLSVITPQTISHGSPRK